MFVVFEGIDGSGKTTVSNMVAERLRARGLSVKHLRAEGKFVSAVSEAIRDLGRDARNLELVPQAEFLLYVARDVQLIEEALRPAMDESDVILADRFLFTAEVLGEKGRALPVEFTRPILKAAAAGLEPDLVILVDVDPVLARARRKAFKIAVVDRRPPSRKGLAGVGLQHRVRRGYLEMAAASPQRWAVVENEDLLEDTVVKVEELIADAHRRGAAAALEGFRAQASARKRVSRASGVLRTPAAALEAFLAWIDSRMQREPRVAAYMLGGMSGPGIDERRRQLAETVPEAVLAALVSLDDATSWSCVRASRSGTRARWRARWGGWRGPTVGRSPSVNHWRCRRPPRWRRRCLAWTMNGPGPRASGCTRVVPGWWPAPSLAWSLNGPGRCGSGGSRPRATRSASTTSRRV